MAVLKSDLERRVEDLEEQVRLLVSAQRIEKFGRRGQEIEYFIMIDPIRKTGVKQVSINTSGSKPVWRFEEVRNA